MTSIESSGRLRSAGGCGALRRASGLVGLCLAMSACSESTSVPTIVGAYTATTFQVASAGQGSRDALAEGGNLAITIAQDNSTSGTLTVPASITGGAPLVASMAGTAVLAGDSVRFEQAANTFVRRGYWKMSGSTLSMTQTADGATIVVTLTR